MKKWFGIAFVLTGAIAQNGCVHSSHSSFSVNALIDPASIKGPIHLKGCDARSQPLRCKTATFECKHPGCERLEVSRENVQPQ